ncbi:MAG TPA: GntR family transcriptional regulator [Anaerolineae bacterium]|nr:GntR family transcriptional regulator [Anaerolineae bacterium]
MLETSLAPARKRTLTEDVTERLRDAILHGHFVPGQPLSEEQLARTLAVSRGPVREALQQLEREGLVLSGPNRRAMVARLSRRHLDQVYSLRLALERLAVQYAVRYAQAADLEAMEAVVQAMKEAVARGLTAREAADLDIAFHDLLYRSAQHDRLYEAWSSLKSQVYIFLLSRNFADPDYRQLMIQGHAQILETLRARDEARALQTIEEHLLAAYSRIVKNYPAEESPEIQSLMVPAAAMSASHARAKNGSTRRARHSIRSSKK